jgi:hypothetical protein
MMLLSLVKMMSGRSPERGLSKQVLGEHPYPDHLYRIKIRASSFCSPLKQLLIFLFLTPHILWTRKFADHLNIKIRIWKIFWIFYVIIYIHIYFKNLFWILNNLIFKFAQKIQTNLSPFYLLFLSELQKNQIKILYNLRDTKMKKTKNGKVHGARLLHSCFPLREFSSYKKIVILYSWGKKDLQKFLVKHHTQAHIRTTKYICGNKRHRLVVSSLKGKRPR